MKEIIKQGQVATLQEKALQAKEAILEATSPKELTQAVMVISQIKEIIKQAKDKLKEAEKEPKETIKGMEKTFKDLEVAIKDKFTETYKVENIVKQIEDKETGEVTFKEVERSNKGKGLFTYTPAKKVVKTDLDAITQETHPHLFKQIWVLDMEALKQEDATKLPTKEVVTEAKVGIQYSKVNEVVKGIK